MQDATRPSHGTHTIPWAGESLVLLPERALWWPRGRVLLLADLHLGKAASFRAAGQPVPAGTTQQNLARLDALIVRHAPEHLVVLGDFLHAAAARTPALLQALAAWRARHAALAIRLVRGNHDRHAGDPPPELGITLVDEPWPLGPFACCHHPQSVAEGFVLAGHLHPVCSLRGPGRDRLRLPCFVVEGHQLWLPAFGEFTGGWRVEPQPGRRLYAIGDGQVWPLAVGSQRNPGMP